MLVDQPPKPWPSTASELGGVSAGAGAPAVLVARPTDLDSNYIGAEGAGQLAAVLPWRPSLVHLDLRNNFIGAEGAIGWRRCSRSARRSPT